MGRVIEPRNRPYRRSRRCFTGDGRAAVPYWPGAGVLPGSESRARSHRGDSGTWENLSSPPGVQRFGQPVARVQRRGSSLLTPVGPRTRGGRAVRPTEGNRGRRDRRQASQRRHGTEEAGEVSPGDPVEGRLASDHGTARRERWKEHRVRRMGSRNTALSPPSPRNSSG
jgi:hypothetical protein